MLSIVCSVYCAEKPNINGEISLNEVFDLLMVV